MDRPVIKVKPCKDGGALFCVEVPPGDPPPGVLKISPDGVFILGLALNHQNLFDENGWHIIPVSRALEEEI